MAYETGISSGTDDLLDKLRLFAIAQGWTVNLHEVEGDGYRLHMNSGTQYVNLRSAPSDIYLRGSTGFDGGSAWNAQPGTTIQCQSNNMPGPYAAYHFFGSSQYLHVVVEATAGHYRHLAMGELNKVGSYAGGAYVGAIYWNTSTTYIDDPNAPYHTYLFDRTSYIGSDTYHTQVRADLDGQINHWFQCSYVPWNNRRRAWGPMRATGGSDAGTMDTLLARSPNAFNALTPLLPAYVYAERDSQLYSPVGHVADLRVCNLTNLAAGDTVTLGSDNWMVFPAHVKRDPNIRDNLPNSGWYGYAYKKVV